MAGREYLHSPNFSSRNKEAISLLVLHYTGMKSASAAISRLCDAEAKVSAHYVIDEDGRISQLVDEKESAWHAGVSYWRGYRNVNTISVGIEIVNPGHEWGYRPFPAKQMEVVAELSLDITTRNGIEARNVVAHSDIAPNRKSDPGELFDWQWLATRGVGLWPKDKIKISEKDVHLKPGDSGDAVLRMQSGLSQYGYEITQNGMFDDVTCKVAIAFQRHFRSGNISGLWDGECTEKLKQLLAVV